MSKSPKRRHKYMHTINGFPAHYYPGGEICYADRAKPIPMCDTLDQIKREQRASVAWRKRQGYPICDKYGWVKVAI